MLENLTFHLKYQLQGQSYSVDFREKLTDNTLQALVTLDFGNKYEKLTLSILPEKEIEIIELYASMDYSYSNQEKVFVNGYQSWTDSREFFIDEKIKGISKLAAPLMKKYQFDKYGDYSFVKYSQKPGEFHGFTYSYFRQDLRFKFIGSLSEAFGYTIIEQDVKKNTLTLRKDCKGLLINKQYLPFQVIWTEGTENEVFDTYFDLMGIKKPMSKPMSGWTSWYNYYANINEKIIMENLNSLKSSQKTIDIFQIDDGYQTAVGDWLSIDKQKFPKGMKWISDQIKACGYQSGIWIAPFVCETTSTIFKEKKHWLVKDELGNPVSAGSNWSGFFILDIDHIEVREYIKEVFRVALNEWGFGLVKLDFLYAVCLLPTQYKTRGQIMTEAMSFLRECGGNKLILGCGVPLGPAFGKVDYCRIGCDVGLDWDDKRYMRLFHRERVSTFHAIQNTVGRRQLNGRAFHNDPDVFFLRNTNISLSQPQKETLAFVNRLFGDLIFTSDDIRDYEVMQHKMFDTMMDIKNRHIEKVEIIKKGLLEINYKEEDRQYLAIINLSKSIVTYSQNSCKIVLQPYESQVLSKKDMD
jgi:alpha-galactosidase